VGGDRVGAIMRAHPSNFRQLGFVEDVPIEALTALGVPVIDDVGSGTLDPLEDEPPVRRSVAAGAALVCFSGDKLLGGPQAGILAGTADAVARARRHPLARALRIDKLSLAALEATLRLHRDAPDEVPVAAMVGAHPETLRRRAERLAEGIGTVVEGAGRVGGGALPLLELRGPVVAVDTERPDELALRLRAGDPPLIARIEDGRLLLDPRTLGDDEIGQAVATVRTAIETAGA
jgi:L-seryl-tRNA(Ser) seleniumtransferase